MKLHQPLSGDIEPQSLSGIIVVPSYDEGADILALLDSVDAQTGVDLDHYAVMVVINNQRQAVQQAVESNRITHEVVQAIQREKMRHELESALPKGTLTEEHLRYFRTMSVSRVRLLLLDLWSHDHAMPKCNVGIARNVGGHVALPFLKPGAPIVFTDADSEFEPGFLHGLQETYADSSVAVADGPVKLKDENELLDIHLELQRMEFQMMELHDVLLHLEGFPEFPDPKVHMMGGANMTVREDVFRAVHGVPHEAFGEDTIFSLRLLNAGYAIKHQAQLSVSTSPRLSHRTQGLGQRLAKRWDHKEDYGELPVRPYDAHRYMRQLQLSIESVRGTVRDADAWRRSMRAFEYVDSQGMATAPLTEEEIEDLRSCALLAPDLEQTTDNMMVYVTARDFAEARYPKKPLKEIFTEFEEHFSLLASDFDERIRTKLSSELAGMPAGTHRETMHPTTHMRGEWTYRLQSLLDIVGGMYTVNAVAERSEAVHALAADPSMNQWLRLIIQRVLPEVEEDLTECVESITVIRWLRKHARLFEALSPANEYVLDHIDGLLTSAKRVEHAYKELIQLNGFNLLLNEKFPAIGRLFSLTLPLRKAYAEEFKRQQSVREVRAQERNRI